MTDENWTDEELGKAMIGLGEKELVEFVLDFAKKSAAVEREHCAIAVECCELDTYDSYRIKEACAKAIRERS